MAADGSYENDPAPPDRAGRRPWSVDQDYGCILHMSCRNGWRELPRKKGTAFSIALKKESVGRFNVCDIRHK